MATHSSILAWRIPWTEEPGGLQSMGPQRVKQGWTTNTFTFSPNWDVQELLNLLQTTHRTLRTGSTMFRFLCLMVPPWLFFFLLWWFQVDEGLPTRRPPPRYPDRKVPLLSTSPSTYLKGFYWHSLMGIQFWAPSQFISIHVHVYKLK